MGVPKPEELTESPDDDKKFSRDSYLSPTFFSHAENCSLGQHLTINRDFTGAADKAVNLVGCKSPHHQLPGRVVSISDACGGNEACSART